MIPDQAALKYIGDCGLHCRIRGRLINRVQNVFHCQPCSLLFSILSHVVIKCVIATTDMLVDAGSWPGTDVNTG